MSGYAKLREESTGGGKKLNMVVRVAQGGSSRPRGSTSPKAEVDTATVAVACAGKAAALKHDARRRLKSSTTSMNLLDGGAIARVRRSVKLGQSASGIALFLRYGSEVLTDKRLGNLLHREGKRGIRGATPVVLAATG